jgi:hypothetical protein
VKKRTGKAKVNSDLLAKAGVGFGTTWRVAPSDPSWNGLIHATGESEKSGHFFLAAAVKVDRILNKYLTACEHACLCHGAVGKGLELRWMGNAMRQKSHKRAK